METFIKMTERYYEILERNHMLSLTTGRDDIKYWLDEHGVKNYDIDEHGVVNVDGNVDLRFKGITEIPFYFGGVWGNFYCNHNQLTSLKGCPDYVYGNFYCGDNKLTTLEDGPENVRDNYECCNNNLTSLKGIPFRLSGLYCSHNNITSFKDGPKYISKRLECIDNQLTGLEYFPRVSESIDCSFNGITNLIFLPKSPNNPRLWFKNNPCDKIYGTVNLEHHIRCILEIDPTPVKTLKLIYELERETFFKILENKDIRNIVESSSESFNELAEAYDISVSVDGDFY